MNYNPYFPGGAISMARVLFDGLVEYDDGTIISVHTRFPVDACYRNARHDVTIGQGRRYLPQLGS